MNFFAFSSIITAVLSIILGIIILSKGFKSKMNQAWFFVSFSVFIWTIGLAGATLVNNQEGALFWQRILYIGTILIPICFFNFCIIFLSREKIKKVFISVGSIIGIFFVFLVFSKFFILQIGERTNFGYWVVKTGSFYGLFLFYFIFYVVYSVFLLKKDLKKYSGIYQKQIQFIYYAALVGFVGGSTNFLLDFNLNIYPVGNFFVVLYVVFISYAILKHHLFEVRVIATELFATAICLILAVKFLLSNGFYDYLINGGMLAVAGVFGLLLVRSVIHEVEQKNKIEAMAVDVKKAYDVEKKAKEELQRLDEAKSQFMMATQHHLRTPLTALKGYLSMTIDGDFGPISDIVKEKLSSCFDSTNRLIKLVNEFLDISKLQLGRDILDIKETSITEMLKDVIVEVKPEADKKGIYLTLILPPEPTSLVMADAVKLREALYNLTDNAVKYTEKGGVKVELQFVTKGKNNRAMVIVTDTGIGMTKEEAADVFGRQFERGKEAKKVYALGRGIGLFITASIIKAHKGKIWADSLGSGQGSAFYVELVAKK